MQRTDRDSSAGVDVFGTEKKADGKPRPPSFFLLRLRVRRFEREFSWLVGVFSGVLEFSFC